MSTWWLVLMATLAAVVSAPIGAGSAAAQAAAAQAAATRSIGNQATAAQATAAQATAAQATGVVTVVHAVRGFLADVYLDGSDRPALSGFSYRRITDPLVVPAGTHRVDLRPAGAPVSQAPVLSGTIEVAAGSALSVVAHVDPAGQPTLAVHPDQGAQVPAGQSVLRVRHGAATGPVDVVVDDRPTFTRLENGRPTPAEQPVAAGRHEVSVRSAADGSVLVAPQWIDLPAGGGATIYLVGDERSDSLGLLVQPGLPAAAQGGTQARVPSGVPSGTSGLADAGGALARLTLPACGAAMAGLALWGARRRRAHRVR